MRRPCELQIRNVVPEDGFKTYKCRTKHKLTGETKLSATAGKLVITEPVGFALPKFSSSSEISTFKTKRSSHYALLCNAQAYPLPSFSLTEPVGSSEPKFAGGISKNIIGVFAESSSQVTILCNAQGAPVPFIQPVGSTLPKFASDSKSDEYVRQNGVSISLQFLKRYKEVVFQYFAPLWLLRFHHSGMRPLTEPVGSAAPKLSSNDKVTTQIIRESQSQLKPVGSSLPKFSTVGKSTTLEFKEGLSFALICPAMASPIPSFRTHVLPVRGHNAQHHDALRMFGPIGWRGFGESQLVPTFNNATYILPFSFGAESVKEGDINQLTCLVNRGDEPLTITWSLKGDVVSSEPSITTTMIGTRASMLMITNVGYRHSGTYTCRATNSAGTATHSAELKVNEPPIINEFSFGSNSVNEGDMAQLACFVSKGDEPLRITWSLKGDVVSSEPSITTTMIGTRTSMLMITNVGYRHSGSYTCRASNAAGSATHSASLLVKGISFVLSDLRKRYPGKTGFHIYQFMRGSFAQLTCSISHGDVPVSISWSLKGDVISSEPSITTTMVGGRTSILIISSVGYRHSGDYTCNAKNIAGMVTYTSTLLVNEPPMIGPFAFPKEVMNEGNFAQLTCVVTSGDLPLSVTWTFHGDKVGTQTGITTTNLGPRLSLLVINSVGYRHRGNYTCQASNNAGHDSYTAKLRVNVRPRWTVEPTDKHFAQGSEAKIDCKSDGFPQPKIVWRKAIEEYAQYYGQMNTMNARMMTTKRDGLPYEEMGYCPPPNRKLPPVPGQHSNYNTIDRIKNDEDFPPPPPIRSADTSLNDSNSTTQSNLTSECSEAECDREPLVKNRAPLSSSPNAKELTTEEMRKLIERNEVVSTSSGLTAFDSVNV
ncbi:DSCAML1 [Lepeophtheirus salmonis]|uniref:DSCAML1 n=1 Tax=Lepeophtheirus salmonis TaxID=72036 RepID=A0A7R8CE44_LEPSM|nr:DSCAML1 [Lepeophtheirus salmonis]CAF2792484.1 DSCAML1 [Lepeophtheirus salmonis]